jgi:hypothetical protein
MQVRNFGDNEVGGDKFDERLRNHLRDKHAAAHPPCQGCCPLLYFSLIFRWAG